MLPLAGKLPLAQCINYKKALVTGSTRRVKLKQTRVEEKLQIKILPNSPDILCPISMHLNTYTNSCNLMLNKLRLRKDVQAQSKYLSMEAFMPPTWASIKCQQEQYIFCELQNTCGERVSERTR